LNAFTLLQPYSIYTASGDEAALKITCRGNTIDKVKTFCFLVCMARQAGIIKIKGNIGGICFYQSDGNHYARAKSSLSGKRVKTSPAFRNTMKYASLLAKASVIGSAVYRLLPKEKRNRKLYQRLTGKAMLMLKEGMTAQEVLVLLKSICQNI